MSETLSIQQQVAILTDTLHRIQAARQHGVQYGGSRDLYSVGGYKRALTYQDYFDTYQRDGIAGQIVDMPAETTWRKPPELSENVDGKPDEGTAFEQAWKELANRLGLWQKFERVDRLSRIGRYAVLLIGTGDDDGSLAKPLSKRERAQVFYVSAYSEPHAQIERWVTSGADERFGLPETYRIGLAGDVGGFIPRGGGTASVHHSRVLHVAEGLLEDEVYGRPALQRIFNDLHDLQKVSTSTGEAFWQRVAGIITATIDPQFTGVDDSMLEDLDTALKELYHDLRRTFYGHGVELSRLAESEPNPKEAAALYMTKIAAGAAIPKRLLFGSETGERASSEDQKTYLGSISERQKQHAEPMILRPFIDRLIQFGALPKPANGYEVVWPELFEVPESEKANTSLTYASAAKALTAVGGNPAELVEIDEERNVWLRPSGERDEVDLDEMQERMEEEKQREADAEADRLREMGNQPTGAGA